MVAPTEVHSVNRMAATSGIQSAVSSGHHWAAPREPYWAENSAHMMAVWWVHCLVAPTEVHSANRMAATLGIQSAVSSGHHWAALREPHLAENSANRMAATSGIQSAVSLAYYWVEPKGV